MFQQMPDIVDKFNQEASLVICQDDTLRVSQELPDNTFDLIISSPPYNIGKNYETKITLVIM